MSEKKETIYPEGIRTFDKNPNQPDFVIGSLVITPNKLVAWLKENENLLTEYNGDKQLKCQILKGDKGLYVKVDTWKPTSSGGTNEVKEQPAEDDLPF